MTREKKKPSEQKIKIICAGLGRTGTLSLTEALRILGYNPYHYIDFNHASAWAQLADGDKNYTANDIIDIIVNDGYDAVLENPTCDIYTDIIKRYPDAKVILTVRDTPEKFEESWKVLMDTVLVTEKPFRLFSFPSFFTWIPIFYDLKKIRSFMGTTHLALQPGEITHGWRNKSDNDDGFLAKQYKRHNQYVIDNIPSKNQLLIFNVKEGWKPLCTFLECEEPKEEDFPHVQVNNTRSLKRMRKIFLIAIYGWIPVTTAGIYLIARHIRKRL